MNSYESDFKEKFKRLSIWWKLYYYFTRLKLYLTKKEDSLLTKMNKVNKLKEEDK